MGSISSFFVASVRDLVSSPNPGILGWQQTTAPKNPRSCFLKLAEAFQLQLFLALLPQCPSFL